MDKRLRARPRAGLSTAAEARADEGTRVPYSHRRDDVPGHSQDYVAHRGEGAPPRVTGQRGSRRNPSAGPDTHAEPTRGPGLPGEPTGTSPGEEALPSPAPAPAPQPAQPGSCTQQGGPSPQEAEPTAPCRLPRTGEGRGRESCLDPTAVPAVGQATGRRDESAGVGPGVCGASTSPTN